MRQRRAGATRGNPRPRAGRAVDVHVDHTGATGARRLDGLLERGEEAGRIVDGAQTHRAQRAGHRHEIDLGILDPPADAPRCRPSGRGGARPGPGGARRCGKTGCCTRRTSTGCGVRRGPQRGVAHQEVAVTQHRHREAPRTAERESGTDGDPGARADPTAAVVSDEVERVAEVRRARLPGEGQAREADLGAGERGRDHAPTSAIGSAPALGSAAGRGSSTTGTARVVGAPRSGRASSSACTPASVSHRSVRSHTAAAHRGPDFRPGGCARRTTPRSPARARDRRRTPAGAVHRGRASRMRRSRRRPGAGHVAAPETSRANGGIGCNAVVGGERSRDADVGQHRCAQPFGQRDARVPVVGASRGTTDEQHRTRGVPEHVDCRGDRFGRRSARCREERGARRGARTKDRALLPAARRPGSRRRVPAVRAARAARHGATTPPPPPASPAGRPTW